MKPAQYPLFVFLRKLVLSALVLGMASCAGGRKPPSHIRKSLEAETGITGIHVVDLKSGKTLLAYNADKNFVPASTTKLLTWYFGKIALGDTLEMLRFHLKSDTLRGFRTLFLEPTGYPLWKYPLEAPLSTPRDASLDNLFNYLMDSDSILLPEQTPRPITPWGPGWSWEDFPYSFATERTRLPLFGNRLWVWKRGDWEVPPAADLQRGGKFVDSIQRDTMPYVILPPSMEGRITWIEGQRNGPGRERYRNRFYLLPPKEGDTLEVPLVTDEELLRNLLRDIAGRSDSTFFIGAYSPEGARRVPMKSLIDPDLDRILKPMLHKSDNFLAEQLLLMVSRNPRTSSGLEQFQDSLLRAHFPDNALRLRWVDGSGLSRYNLLSPSFLTLLLRKIDSVEGVNGWQNLLPRIQKPGDTIPRDSLPLIHAKSGSMSGIYNLSGYMQTRKGRWVAFAIMNNHSTRTRSELYLSVYALLREIHRRY